MLIKNPSSPVEIGRGHLRYELEEVERSTGGGGLDHKVTGGSPESTAAAADGGARWGARSRRGGRGRRAREAPRAHPGDVGADGEVGGGWTATGWSMAGSVGRGEDGASEVDWGVPAPIPCARGKRLMARSSWRCWLAPGWPE